jgi:transposase
METTKQRYCGIDVSSEVLDVCFQHENATTEHFQVKNQRKGYAEILKRCGSCHYIMENTGVYHLELMFYLHQHQQRFTIVNALQIKRYIQMQLQRGKSDKKDALRICMYGMDRAPEPTQMPEKIYFECRSLNNAVHDLTKDITKWTNQIHALKRCGFDTTTLIKSYQRIVKQLRVEKKNLQVLLQEKLLQWNGTLLKQISSVKGIGKCAAAELMIYTKSFRGITNYRQLISYAGLNPVEHTSGSSIRGRIRICKQGGKQLRHILYMCALNAKKTNRACRDLFDRMVAKGKNKKVAVIAVCNKLLKQVFGCIKNNQCYMDDYVKIKA